MANEIPTAVRVAMLKRRLTQRSIAQKLGIGQQSVSKILRGNTRLLGLQHRPYIAEMLGLDETDIWPDKSTKLMTYDEIVGDTQGATEDNSRT